MNWRPICILSCLALTGHLVAEEEEPNFQEEATPKPIAQEAIKIVQEASSGDEGEAGFAEKLASRFWGF